MTKVNTTFDYKHATEQILGELKRDRDRQIIARRFSFGLKRRQTLEKIGRDFNITRERVRQIEKAALTKMRESGSPYISNANQALQELIVNRGGVTLMADLADQLNAEEGDIYYLVFLALLASGVDVIEDDDRLRLSVGISPIYSRNQLVQLIQEITRTIKEIGKPVTVAKLQTKLPSQLETATLEQLMLVSKDLSELEGKWGLSTWPSVNPRSIRDRTYLVLTHHGRPLHFADIAHHVRNLGKTKRDVTMQAVHNELIKDERFILIGRGIYALAEWGYTPGTVADIIAGVLREEQPLHKDEIVRRVLAKRQVKTTTIVLNLQEKPQFVRTTKATYRLKED
jgi:hypothetical protein